MSRRLVIESTLKVNLVSLHCVHQYIHYCLLITHNEFINSDSRCARALLHHNLHHISLPPSTISILIGSIITPDYTLYVLYSSSNRQIWLPLSLNLVSDLRPIKSISTSTTAFPTTLSDFVLVDLDYFDFRDGKLWNIFRVFPIRLTPTMRIRTMKQYP